MNIQAPFRQATQRHAYRPEIDGLRFFAFLLVFIHHSPRVFSGEIYAAMKLHGWIGVDLFFVLSSYLLFSNLIREYKSSGTINVQYFYGRRLLRIYPLMAFYLAAVLLLFTPHDGWHLRLLGNLFFFDNIIAWFSGYNGKIIASAHLWTLSFEFQFYLVIPFIFFIFVQMGQARFFLYVAIFCLASTVARLILSLQGVEHPTVYVTPFLRPEAICAGIVLAAFSPRWHWAFSLAVAAVALPIAIATPQPWQSAPASMVQYPLTALGFAGLLDAVLRSEATGRALAWRPIAYLGTISYGLYIYHYAIRHIMRQASWPQDLSFVVVMLLATISVAAISYRFIEQPFLIRKNRLRIDDRQIA